MRDSAIPALVLLAAAVAAPAAPQEAPGPDLLDALSGRYSFGLAEKKPEGCIVTLEASGDQAVRMGGRCKRYAVLHEITRWEPTGGGGIRLMGGKPLREISDFSPVQDGSGVYLRGGFADDSQIYELRPPQ
ncbi:MAG: hypothetical protein GC155_10560 [Alphaproteobacteria bacterium]|nr:hypothetical protein [Alphaproteobacteria bacterium]